MCPMLSVLLHGQIIIGVARVLGLRGQKIGGLGDGSPPEAEAFLSIDALILAYIGAKENTKIRCKIDVFSAI